MIYKISKSLSLVALMAASTQSTYSSPPRPSSAAPTAITCGNIGLSDDSLNRIKRHLESDKKENKIAQYTNPKGDVVLYDVGDFVKVEAIGAKGSGHLKTYYFKKLNGARIKPKTMKPHDPISTPKCAVKVG